MTRGEAIQARLTLGLAPKTGKSGTTYGNFCIRNLKNDELIACVAFREVAERLSAVTVGSDLSIMGYWSDEDKIFKVQDFATAKIESKKAKKHKTIDKPQEIDLICDSLGYGYVINRMRTELKTSSGIDATKKLLSSKFPLEAWKKLLEELREEKRLMDAIRNP